MLPWELRIRGDDSIDPRRIQRYHLEDLRRCYWSPAQASTSDLIGWGPWSWSPDGRKLSGNKLRFARGDGILVYNLETIGRSISLFKKTHQDIAADIGTSREVISRILKEFEHSGLVTLSRGEIRADDLEELRRTALT